MKKKVLLILKEKINCLFNKILKCNNKPIVSVNKKSQKNILHTTVMAQLVQKSSVLRGAQWAKLENFVKK